MSFIEGQETVNTQFKSGRDMKEIRTAATDGFIMCGTQFFSFLQGSNPVNRRVDYDDALVQIQIQLL